MKISLVRTLLACTAGTIALTAQAASITGNYGFSGGSATLDSDTVNSATQVLSWNGPITIGSATGDLAASIGDTVTLTAPWSFNSGALASLWSANGWTFDLTSSAIANQNGGFLNVNGLGTLSGGGLDPTPYTFNFSAQDPNAGADPVSGFQFTFSASGNPPPGVPDGGTTVALLGVALAGLAIARRKLSA
jgi:hypothetical protein